MAFRDYNRPQQPPQFPPRGPFESEGEFDNFSSVREREVDGSVNTIDLTPEQSTHLLGVTADGVDAGKSSAYWGMANVFWPMLFFTVVVVSVIVVSQVDSGGSLGSGSVSYYWSGQGGRRQNDRNVPVSSWWSGVAILDPPTYIFDVTNSSSSNPAVGAQHVYYTIYDGTLVALDKDTFELIWRVNICEDVFNLSPIACSTALDNQLYYSVATPTLWGDKLVLAIKQPPSIAVLYQSNGQMVSYPPGSPNPLILDTVSPYAEVTQSGTVWGNTYWVGTSISKSNAILDQQTGCTFVGHFKSINLDDMTVNWDSNMRSPSGLYPPGNMFNDFAGMPIKGSSPAYSSHNNLIMFSVGEPHCANSAFWDCLAFTPYVDQPGDCLGDPAYNETAMYSIVALDGTSGELVWFEQLYGYRTWQLACDPLNYAAPRPDPCDAYEPPAICPFGEDRFVNCVDASLGQTYPFFDWRMDPSLQITGDKKEVIFVGQNTGIIYAIKVTRDPNPPSSVPVPRSERFLWATATMNWGPGIGGLAVDGNNVFFTVFKAANWTIGIDSITGDTIEAGVGCGGWGALDVVTGLSTSWGRYIEIPRCTERYDAMWIGKPAGIYSPPTVTNDILLITAGDTPFLDWECFVNSSCVCNCPCRTTNSTDFGGTTYIASALTGNSLQQYMTGAGFYQQGFAVKDYCIYTGNGFLNTSPAGILPDSGTQAVGQIGNKLMAWCVDSPIVKECSVL